MYLFETFFDLSYLVLVLSIGLYILFRAKTRQGRYLGAMAVVLGAGDAFHLVPRVIAMTTAGGFEAMTAALGIGQAVTSVTMTVFYVLLYQVYRLRYRETNRTAMLYVYLLAAVRILLCLLPQNGWTLANPPYFWNLLRNIPFALLGAGMIRLFSQKVKKTGDEPFRFLPLAIFLSFFFYAIVVVFVSFYPWTGIFMVPKTAVYVWIVLMGLNAFRTLEK